MFATPPALAATLTSQRYGQRDSRPLDPPPVVQVKMHEIIDYGTPGERRVELDVR